MTKSDFLKETQRLIDVFSSGQWPSHRIDTMWNSVQNLDHKWWKEQVDNAVLSADFRYNFLEAIRFEKNRRAMEQRADDLKLHKHSASEEGFSKVLEMFKANSMSEALENYRDKLKRGTNE